MKESMNRMANKKVVYDILMKNRHPKFNASSAFLKACFWNA